MITSKIYFCNKGENQSELIYCNYDGYVENVWVDIKQAIKELQNNKSLTFNNLIEKILDNDNYEIFIEDNINTFNNKKSNLFIDVDYSNYFVKIESNNGFKDTYIIVKSNIGNCIDDFISRGVESRMNIINEYIEDIKLRIDKRTNTNEYHQTSCYEKDFFQISQIQKNAQKIVDNCKKQLELISEKYTKIE